MAYGGNEISSGGGFAGHTIMKMVEKSINAYRKKQILRISPFVYLLAQIIPGIDGLKIGCLISLEICADPERRAARVFRLHDGAIAQGLINLAVEHQTFAIERVKGSQPEITVLFDISNGHAALVNPLNQSSGC